MKRIHDSLQRLFQRHRLLFWYDPTGEWATTFDAYADESVVKLKVAGNEFATKFRIVREPNPDARFLVYLPTHRPADVDNWLLDLLLQGYQFKADKASLALQEAGLPDEFLYLTQEHAAFFQSGKRIQALKELIGQDDQARELRLKMMAVLAGTAVDVDALLLRFLDAKMDAELFDPVVESFEASALVESFWGEVQRIFGYAADQPSLRDFAVSLFRGANPLDDRVTLHPHSKVFLQRWQDSQAHGASFRLWATQMERELQVAASLGAIQDRADLGDWDTFEIFDKFILHRLCKSFEKGAAAGDLRAVIQQRRGSFWWPQHEHGYAAVEQALELRELLAAAEQAVDSLEAGVNRYTGSWWRIDMAYRRCIRHLRRYGHVQVMENIAQWVEKSYVNNFLLPLADRWSDQIRTLDHWACPGVFAQRRFFNIFVQPFRDKGQKVFVIISDALRYEAAADFAQRLQSANRWTAEVEALWGSLPTYVHPARHGVPAAGKTMGRGCGDRHGDGRWPQRHRHRQPSGHPASRL